MAESPPVDVTADYDTAALFEALQPTINPTRLLAEAREAVFIKQATDKLSDSLIDAAIDGAIGRYRAGDLSPLDALLVFARLAALRDFQDALDSKARGIEEAPQDPT